MTGSAPRSRADLLAWYRRNRERSRTLFDLLSDRAYYSQPIELRHPIVFYEGHLPAFSFNTLVKKALGGASIDEHLEALFARGIDPDEPSSDELQWPSRDVVRSFADEADRRVVDALQNADLDQPGHPLLNGGEAVFSILEHEAMHHETLLYMWHRLPFSDKKKPMGYSPRTEGVSPPAEWVDVPGGPAVLGVERDTIPFGWDNECPALVANVPSFAIERHDVTNDRFLEFVEGGGYQNERWWSAEDWRWIQTEGVAHPLFWERSGDDWYWRGMFDRIPLPSSWPVYVTYAEASAFARWRGSCVCRPSPNSSVRLMAPRTEIARTPGDTRSHRQAQEYSTWRAGTRSPQAAIRAVRVRGGSKTWWATVGSGPTRRSLRSRDFKRYHPTPSTLQISSTVGIS